jgi:hypothetical protein
VRPWLYRVAHNAAIDVVKRRRELPAAELPDRPAADGAREAAALVAALSALPERQRRVYVLRELHGLRIDETAAELGMTVPQVEQALFAARNRMAEHLVFGDRLNCVAVQRLAAGPLDLDERRALKTHLRSCPECRRAVGTGTSGFAWLPFSPVDWLRGLGGIAGGSAPLAAKVGAVVATATIAAGVPIAIETTHIHPQGQSRPAGPHLRSTATGATDQARSSTPAVVPVAFIRHHRAPTVTHDSAAVARHGAAPVDGAPTGPTAPHDPVDTGPTTSSAPPTTTTTSNDGPGDGGGTGGGDRSSTDGGTTTTDDSSGSGDDTTQTTTTSSDDGATTTGGGTTSGGDGTSSDGGSSGTGSGDTSTTSDGSGSGSDGGTGGDLPPPPGSHD